MSDENPLYAGLLDPTALRLVLDWMNAERAVRLAEWDYEQAYQLQSTFGVNVSRARGRAGIALENLRAYLAPPIGTTDAYPTQQEG